jgi:hypothetical protein
VSQNRTRPNDPSWTREQISNGLATLSMLRNAGSAEALAGPLPRVPTERPRGNTVVTIRSTLSVYKLSLAPTVSVLSAQSSRCYGAVTTSAVSTPVRNGPHRASNAFSHSGQVVHAIDRPFPGRRLHPASYRKANDVIVSGSGFGRSAP